MNTRNSYWDLDRCAWVENDPTSPRPPTRPAEHAHERSTASAFPAPDAGLPVQRQAQPEQSGLL